MFTGAFIAATVLPGGSELLLVGFIQQASVHWLWLVVAASIGNTLGSVTSYYLGRLGRIAQTPELMAKGNYQRSFKLLQRYGSVAMLFAWAPVVGDVLCILAGWLRLPIGRTCFFIAIGKTFRYFIVAAVALQWFEPAVSLL